MENFELVTSLQSKALVTNLTLCTVLLEDKVYPWILLVPRIHNVMQINQLSEANSIQLMKEINLMSNVMEKCFPTTRLNVAAIGNKTPQLHVHIICRHETDELWPDTVWNKPMNTLTSVQQTTRVVQIQKALETFTLHN